jgi:signal transduction histidine kinase
MKLTAETFRIPACVVLASAAVAAGADATWDERLAKAASGRLKEIERELAELAPKLDGLPGIPVDDQGGTGGFASIHTLAVPQRGERHAVEVRWQAGAENGGDPPLVDRVALVPARRYDAKGLDPHFGMPDRFTVELIDVGGNTVKWVAREKDARSHPVRRGHPFVYQISPPVAAAGLRVTAELLVLDSEAEKDHVHAWAEVFAFQGTRNLASAATVKTIGGSAPQAPWQWRPEFLVDGQTPLGLPESPVRDHRNVGWLSNGRNNARESAALTIDLGAEQSIDAVRLLPARRPTSDLPSGFGFPRKLAISVSATGAADSWQTVLEGDFRNPGHNPVLIPFEPATGRHVKINAVELWKEFQSYPAFFALSEVEVLAGAENLALGKVVRSSDGMLNLIAPGGRYWSGAALSDGFGPDGRLVPASEWMELLDQRLRIETRLHELREEAGRVVNGWRNTGLSVFALLGLAGAFAIIALPIRYRIHARQELMKVRERIAGDLHDEVGSNLGSIQMFADLAEGRSGPSDELKRIQRIASETVSAVRDIVWLLRPGGDHRIGTVEHLRETSSIMLESLKWKFSANEPSWQIELPEEANRHLFLFFREALHNIMRHAKAECVDIHVDTHDSLFQITITDDGVGIDAERLDRPSTLRALRQRADALDAELHVETLPAKGTTLTLAVPLGRKRRRKARQKPVAPPPDNS